MKPHPDKSTPILRLYFPPTLKQSSIARLLDKLIPLDFHAPTRNRYGFNANEAFLDIEKGHGATAFINYVSDDEVALSFGSEKDRSWEYSVPTLYNMSQSPSVSYVFERIAELVSPQFFPEVTLAGRKRKVESNGIHFEGLFILKAEVKAAYDALFNS